MHMSQEEVWNQCISKLVWACLGHTLMEGLYESQVFLVYSTCHEDTLNKIPLFQGSFNTEC